MKKTNSIKKLLSSMAIVSSAALTFAPATTQAGEVSYNAAVSNMYLWRGINISNPSPAVFGGIDYAADSGLYVGTWTSSEGAFDGSAEVDLYGGFSGSAGDFGYDIGYAAYLYPYASKDMFTFSADSSGNGSMLADYIVGLSFKDLSFTAYINAETGDAGNNKYLTLDYAIGKFGLHGGINMNDNSADEYTEFNVSYAATDSLTFTLSKAQGDGVKSIVGGLGANADGGENPVLQVTYALPI